MRFTWPAAALLCGLLLLCGSFYAQSGARESWRFEQVQVYASGGHLGVGLTDIDADRATALKLGEPRGVEVRTVQENSPAAAAGIEPGDVLLTYNGEEILSGPQLGRLVNETPPGRKVKIQYWRQGKTKMTTALLTSSTSRPPDPLPSSSALPPWSAAMVPRMLMLWDDLTLGIECEPMDSQIAQYFGVRNGILVRHVEKGYAGDKAGIKAGDVITSIDTRSVAVPRDLISYLRTQHQPGKIMSIAIVRDHKARTLSITLNE
jgi:serine protease Do